jgi:ATP-binding cassette subfamily C (CFTR/MRP) protein 1
LIGEVVINHGSIVIAHDEIAYCIQDPWLFHGSIRQNIVGVDKADDVWLKKVTWACGLDRDFQELPDGIETRVGNDGTSLSGGQKNRISLARAVYSRSPLLVLDDVLSGLDSRTERLVFDRVLGPRGILREVGVTVVLTTHAVGWLRFADTVIVVDDGRLSYQGKPENAPASFIQDHTGTDSEYEATQDDDDKSISALPTKTPRSASISSSEAANKTSNWQLYKSYFKSFGTFGFISFVLLIVMFSALQCVQQLVLKWWAGAEATAPAELGKWVGILGAITLIFIIDVTVTLYVGFIYLFPKSSLYLHAQQFTALVKVRYSAWGGKETGNITNRFSQDISIVDGTLANSLLNVLAGTFDVAAMMGVIVVATPFIAATFPVLMAVFWVIQSVYLRTGKQLRIMDLEAKAPLCTHFLETVSGAVTIKSFGWPREYREKNERLLEESQTPYYLLESGKFNNRYMPLMVEESKLTMRLNTVQNWLSLVLNLVVAGLATVTMAIVVKLRTSSDAGYVALALINIMDIGPILEYLVIAWTQLETSMGAIARMKEFITSTPSEEEGKGQQTPPPKEWLQKPSTIAITNLSASYAEDTPNTTTLKNITLEIQPGQKVAICGRTGSGKSSLASAIFGLLHITSGTITISDVNISTTSPQLLRSKMIALPQDCYFTPGTVRENLSLRMESHDVASSDAAMLLALQKVGLLQKLSTLASSCTTTPLNLPLEPKKMLTKGQCQLFALARALLSTGSILLLDEATSGLDGNTEKTMQRLIREEFAHCTVIAVAHHLHTIMDFDLVVVMQGGRVGEVGRPGELVRREGSLFGGLVRVGGG